MSLRRTDKKVPAATAAPVAVAPSPNLNKLSHVLSVGIANSASVDAGIMTEREFEAEVERLVEFEAAKMSRMSEEEYERWKKMAKDKTREYTMKAQDAAMRGSKEAARLTKQGAQEIVKQVKLMWDGAKNAIHFATATNKELKKRLKKDYRVYFVADSWRNLKASQDGAKMYTADTGGNLYSKIEFDDNTVRVSVTVYFREKDPEYAVLGDKVFHSEFRDLGQGMDAITYDSICRFVDSMIDICVDTVMAPFAKKK